MEKPDRYIVASHGHFDNKVSAELSDKNIDPPLVSIADSEIKDEVISYQDREKLQKLAIIPNLKQDALVEANRVPVMRNNDGKIYHQQEEVDNTKLDKIKKLSKSGFWVSIVAIVPFLLIILGFLFQYESLYTLIPILGLILLILVIVGLVYSVRAKKRNRALLKLPTTTDDERSLLNQYRKFSRAGIIISSILLGILILSIILFIVMALLFLGVVLMGF